MKPSVIADPSLCAVNEKVLCAVAAFGSSNFRAGKIAPIFIIVPDRATLFVEKFLTSHMPAVLGVRVVTFTQLYNILNPDGGAVLDKTSAVLYMWRAICDTKGDLEYFSKSAEQYAFAEKMFNTVNQLTSCSADFSTLEKNAIDAITKRKMHDISAIWRRYKELTAAQTDGSGVLDYLIKHVSTADVVRNAHFYVCGFEHLSVQRAEVVRQIMSCARSMTIGVIKGGELAGWLDEILFAI
jgi:ATP-dependent helicase/DNAse subunit B